MTFADQFLASNTQKEDGVVCALCSTWAVVAYEFLSRFGTSCMGELRTNISVTNQGYVSDAPMSNTLPLDVPVSPSSSTLKDVVASCEP